MPLQATSGAASYDGFGGGVAVVPTFIEDVFSCFLYTGNDSTQTITNGVNLSANGGLVWIKARTATYSHILSDTVRGTGKFLSSNTTDAQGTDAQDVTAFNTTGFTVGNNSRVNNSSFTYASWTFRKQPKFFDIVTYTGTGSSQAITHNLGSTPGCIITKSVTDTEGWSVYHRSLTAGNILNLSATSAEFTLSGLFSSVTSSSFTVGTNSRINSSGQTFIAYLFAHDAGGFGLTGTDNVISCGSYTGVTYPNSLEVTLGYEPQFVIIKNSNTVSGWTMWDIMRGMAVVPAANTAQALLLEPNTSAADSNQPGIFPTATGFVVKNGLTSISSPSDKMIYIAIRRGPMKVPTTGTSVFNPSVPTGFAQFTTGFPVDLGLWNYRTGYSENTVVNDRLRGVSTKNTSAFPNNLITSSTVAEQPSQGTQNWNNTGLYAVTSGAVFYSFRRAPSFFDEVCYTGTGSSQNVAHNLAAVPELLIIKSRSQVVDWNVWSKSGTQRNDYKASLNAAGDYGSTGGDLVWGTPASGAPNMTSTTFSLGDYIGVNNSGSTYVAYLFATCAGVSKVFSYTGNGSSQTIDCGFTAGARFVLIKRINSTGNWYVWDTARGIVSGNDPYLLLNSTAAEVTTDDTIDTDSTGFVVNQVSATNVNVSSATYLGLAIA